MTVEERTAPSAAEPLFTVTRMSAAVPGPGATTADPWGAPGDEKLEPEVRLSLVPEHHDVVVGVVAQLDARAEVDGAHVQSRHWRSDPGDRGLVVGRLQAPDSVRRRRPGRGHDDHQRNQGRRGCARQRAACHAVSAARICSRSSARARATRERIVPTAVSQTSAASA